MLRRVYVDHQVRLHRAPPASFEYRQEAVTAGPLTVGRLVYKMDMEIQTEPLGRLLFVAAGSGQLEARAGREARRLAPGDVLLNETGRPMTNTCLHAEAWTLDLDPGLVAGYAAERTGIDGADFRFEGMTPRSPEMRRYWRDTMLYLHRLLEPADTPASEPLVLRAALELTAAAALAAFPNTAMSVPYLPGPGYVAPAAVRRAVGYIDAHADEPVTASQIAAAAGVTPRALQAAFQRHLGLAPMAYLRRVRLERAHRDLQSADPARGDTVAAIARRWGFAHLGRFARLYQDEYGRTPSQTLRT